MNALAGDCLLLAWVGLSISAVGVAACHALTRFRGIELIGYGLAAGVVIHALLGLIMGAWAPARPFATGLLFILPVASLVYLWRRGAHREVLRRLPRALRWSLALWLVFLVVCIGITHLEVDFPSTLPDGRYIFKEHTLNVRVQYLAALPADNYIPFIVTEYLLRQISFREERPLLPNNEVSNRTILMSLVALPFRAVLGGPETPKSLGRFRYVGQEWPDVGKLNENGYFEQFLVVGIFLNSLMLVGLFVLFSRLRARKILVAAALLYLTNPYLLSHTVFTWPKALAGFFILLAWNSLHARHDPRLVALCLGLAYNCHPYAAAFAVPVGLFYLWQWWRGTARLGAMPEFALVFLLSILPWLLWTKVWLGIPSNLVSQNFASTAGALDLVWVRLVNLVNVLTPRFLTIYPFDATTIFENYVTCLPGAVGVVVILPALAMLARSSFDLRWPIILSALALLPVFSAPALAVLHGYQPIVGALLFLGTVWLREAFSLSTFRVLVALQLLNNVGLVAMQAWLVGAHLA